MRRTMMAAIAAALWLTAGAVRAEEHEVVILGDGFFPGVVYAVPGDTVRFVNAGDGEAAATATDETWSTGVMPPAGEVMIEVVAGMSKPFDNRMPAVATTTTTTQAETTTDDSATEAENVDWDPESATSEALLEWENPAPVQLDALGAPIEATNADSTTSP
ncbi:cupredoxin domain-containing protein [Roseivivax sediminis]|uniref:Plastocyanin n=1 Tax=Roseivivax sediminis TaxID=936889 RepID=A0A1I2DR99_9RHOB|nr:hypothetical protein [Roseivivax sediminis]SFE83056.1 hypothetical protein SAMN04515678_11815 [Roseivivax sediminis]